MRGPVDEDVVLLLQQRQHPPFVTFGFPRTLKLIIELRTVETAVENTPAPGLLFDVCVLCGMRVCVGGVSSSKMFSLRTHTHSQISALYLYSQSIEEGADL